MFVKQPHQEKKPMKTITIPCSAALLLALAAPTLGHAQSVNPATLFNQANQMNNEEQDMAKELKSKAGDNQALITMADTIQEDHKANQAALEALASQKKVTLKSYEKNKAAQDQLDNLKGAQFNQSFLKMDIRDHEKALASFRRARREFSGDPDVLVYIDETIPVLEAHLKMAQNLHRDDKMLGSKENAATNKD
jgi:putative membrane protein